jgi:transcriptional regulator with XRE-family HTH domain
MPLELPPADHARLAKIIRQLRRAARLTRTQLARETDTRAGGLKHGERGKHPFPRCVLRRLLLHPCMRDLPALAAAAGIKLELSHRPQDKE